MKKVVRSFTFLGVRWALKIVARLGKDGKGDDGDTDGDTHTIRVRQDLRGIDELETYIHEFLHACCWWLDETYVEPIARDIARALWRLGYRRVDE